MLQLIPAISSLTPVTTAIPLIGVLTLTAVKDAYDDIVSREQEKVIDLKCSKRLNRFIDQPILLEIGKSNDRLEKRFKSFPAQRVDTVIITPFFSLLSLST